MAKLPSFFKGQVIPVPFAYFCVSNHIVISINEGSLYTSKGLIFLSKQIIQSIKLNYHITGFKYILNIEDEGQLIC